DNNLENEKIFRFNDSVNFRGHHFIVNKDPFQSISSIKGEPFKLTFLNPLSVTGYYVGGLKIDWAEEGAGVLNMTLTGSNPAKEIDFMNGLIEEYQNFDLEKKNQTAERTIQFIKQQLLEISDSLTTQEGKLLQLKIQNSSYGASFTLSFASAFAPPTNSSVTGGGSQMSSTNGQTTDMSDDVATRLYSELATLQGQKAELIIRSNYFDYLEEYVKSNKTLDLIVLPASLGIQDDVLSGIVDRIIDLQLEAKIQLEKGLG
ncbi:MAG: hypothetical protein QM734_08135, partial [Cyclobacteriaceae bacterium]